MSPLEYMEKQLLKIQLNYDRESTRGAPDKTLNDIKAKIGYYTAAIDALRRVEGGGIS